MKRIYILLTIFFCSISAFAQNDKLMSLRKLSEQPLYVLYDTTNFKKYAFDDFICKVHSFYKGKIEEQQIIIITPKDLSTNKKVYRLALVGNYYDSIPFSRFDFPNLQELILGYPCALPKQIDKFKKLQLLMVETVLDEGCGCYYGAKPIQTLDSLGYMVPYMFPKQIANLSELRMLYYVGGELTISYLPTLTNLKHLKYLYYSNHKNSEVDLCIDISTLQRKYVNISNLQSYSSFKERLPNCIDKDYRRTFIESLQINGTHRKRDIQAKGKLKKGNLDGKWLIWYKNGVLSQERFYKNGVDDSVWTFWDTTGFKEKQIYFTQGNIDSVKKYIYDIHSKANSIKTIFKINDYANRVEKTESFKDSCQIYYEMAYYKNNNLYYKWSTGAWWNWKDKRIALVKEYHTKNGETKEYYDINNLMFAKEIRNYKSISTEVIYYNERGEIIKSFIY